MRKASIVVIIIFYPLLLILTAPVEFPLWVAYKRSGYDVPGYFKFLFDRMTKFKSYKKQ